MRFISAVTVGVLITATSSLSGAQAPTAAGDAHAPQTTADMQSLIKAFSGNWSLNLRLEPSKEVPNGLDGTGTETWHADAGRVTLTDEETLNAGPQTISVLGLLWRDKARIFHAMDCSNANPDTCDLKGAVNDVIVTWTGSELTIDEREVSSDGKVMTSRAVWSDITPNSFTETGYLGPQGGPFQKAMTIHATRTAGVK
jgi:hypothetical protein